MPFAADAREVEHAVARRQNFGIVLGGRGKVRVNPKSETIEYLSKNQEKGRGTWYYPCRGCATDDLSGCGAANRTSDEIVKDGSSPARFCEELEVCNGRSNWILHW